MISGTYRALARWTSVRAGFLAALVMFLLLAQRNGSRGARSCPAQAATGAPSPRAVATSENYQLVAIAEGEVLVIYLDRAADNAPVIDAVIELTLDGAVFKAEAQRAAPTRLLRRSSRRWHLRGPGIHQ